MRKGTIEMQKIVAWALGVVLALVLIYFIVSEFGADKGGLMSELIEKITNLRG